MSKYHVTLTTYAILTWLALFSQAQAGKLNCNKADIRLQILGSGGPELTPDRASSSYLIWHNNNAIIMIDAGGGSSMRFAQSRAEWRDLKAVLFSHFHADHSNDLPALIKASWFGDRQQDLPIFGPYGNHLMPSTSDWLKRLFADQAGAYGYLSDFYQKQKNSGYLLKPHDLKNTTESHTIYSSDNLTIIAQQVQHGPIPAFAYQINICGRSIVFSGDTNGEGLRHLQVDKTDLFIAHNAIPESAGRIARSLHMTPSQIGQIATHLKTTHLLLSHRMRRSISKENDTTKYIRQHYDGPLTFVNDLDIFRPSH